ncbi:hypothetical protein QNH18_03085 [Bacillus paralicheniformis]|uniref:hypothetical protein n=1 Tax=Bacillus paralicheniformis TaxID=1648923 RepID=UPI000C77B614|nr:hypothetical protein [Bacillus paralicheniformis]PLC14576.1 hypothetical protein BV582_17170 [Bacillus paralicheniformis]WHX87329.1 hypothetical protein QNH18_03085 [Bacillus paralicheniformis]
MTTIIGANLGNGVLLTADTKTSNIDSQGANLGTFYASEKITSLRPNMIMATAGLSALGKSIRSLLESVLNVKDQITVKQTNEHIKETFQYSYSLFKNVNNTIAYDHLIGLLGGYDEQKKRAFFYSFSNENHFIPEEVEGSIFAVGEGQKEVMQFINDRFNEYRDSYQSIARLFSMAIRNINSDNVSKDTFSILCLFDLIEKQYKISRMHVDSKGILKSL